MDQRMYLFDRIFELIEADEWTLKHMEDNPKMFPLANYEWVANKVSSFTQNVIPKGYNIVIKVVYQKWSDLKMYRGIFRFCRFLKNQSLKS